MKLFISTMIFKTGLWGLFLFLPIISGVVYAQSNLSNQVNPKAIYDRMQINSRIYDFTGTLTYEQGGQLQSFEVDSSSTNGLTYQRLALLDGPESVHFMQFDANCSKAVTAASDQLSAYYNFYIRGEARVAGHDGIEIILSPVDKYRNGFQFVVDTETGLMLRSVVLTPDRRMVERIQFVSLDYQRGQEDQQLRQQSLKEEQPDEAEGNQQIEGLETVEKGPNKVNCDQLSIENGWSTGWLPEGFALLESELDAERAVLVYGDGLSVFSVFIESVQENFLPPSNAQRGATTVYINYLSNQSSTYLVSIVGEIPLATAERVMSTLRRN